MMENNNQQQENTSNQTIDEKKEKTSASNEKEDEMPLQVINNEAIQMTLRNKEDDYLTQKKDGEDEGLTKEEEELVSNCNIKEKLIVKLEELDHKIFMLLQSNQYLKEELEDTSIALSDMIEYKEYIAENEDVILK